MSGVSKPRTPLECIFFHRRSRRLQRSCPRALDKICAIVRRRVLGLVTNHRLSCNVLNIFNVFFLFYYSQ